MCVCMCICVCLCVYTCTHVIYYVHVYSCMFECSLTYLILPSLLPNSPCFPRPNHFSPCTLSYPFLRSNPSNPLLNNTNTYGSTDNGIELRKSPRRPKHAESGGGGETSPSNSEVDENTVAGNRILSHTVNDILTCLHACLPSLSLLFLSSFLRVTFHFTSSCSCVSLFFSNL